MRTLRVAMSNGPSAASRGEFGIDDSASAVLASERRRTVLRTLRDADGSLAIADLARDVVASERDGSAGDAPEAAVERVALTLHHRHLPKLADGGYLRYDPGEKTVVPRDDLESLVPIFAVAAERAE